MIAPISSAEEVAAHATHSTMRAMAREVGTLLPLVIVDREFERPGAPAKAAAAARRLAAHAHRLQRGFAPVGADPILIAVAGGLEARVERAASLLENGMPERGRAQARRAIAYCIACHTRAAGPAFDSLLDPSDLARLAPIERGDLLAATRDFPAAMAQYEAALRDPKFAVERPHRFEATARKLLAIVVRVRQDPEETLRRLEALRAVPSAPEGFRRELALWQGAAKAWRQEDDAEQLFEGGSALIRRSGVATAAFIHDLRAAAKLHDLLRTPQPGRTLLLAGLVSERLAILDFWGLAEAYYEACIRSAPASKEAGECYARLERLLPYAGVLDHGVAVRGDKEQAKLDELRALAARP